MFRLVFLAFLVFLAAPAWAQDAAAQAPGLPTGIALASLVVGIVLGVALTVLRGIAPLTRNTYDDAALRLIEEAAPVIRRWMDPNDPSIPPSPSNPDGRAA